MSKAIVDFNQPVPLAEEEDTATLAAIDRGIRDVPIFGMGPGAIHNIFHQIEECISVAQVDARQNPSGFLAYGTT